MAKSWQVGRAAQNGFLAAWLASKGATASDAVFDGADGFFATYSMGYGKPAEEIAGGIVLGKRTDVKIEGTASTGIPPSCPTTRGRASCVRAAARVEARSYAST
jgi:hypothetical protein